MERDSSALGCVLSLVDRCEFTLSTGRGDGGGDGMGLGGMVAAVRGSITEKRAI